MEEDYTPQSPTVTVLRPSSSADFHLAEQALARGASSSKIQAAFRRHRERLLFRMLVFVVRRAAACPPRVLLAKLNPREAALIRDDPKLRVQLRLGGRSFPPRLLFKVVCGRRGGGTFAAVAATAADPPWLEAARDAPRLSTHQSNHWRRVACRAPPPAGLAPSSFAVRYACLRPRPTPD